MSDGPLRVAILGAGTVGREVALAFLQHPERLAPIDGRRLVLAGVAVRDLGRHADSSIPADLLTDAPAHLVADPDVDVVVDVMGGDEPARTLTAVALAAGKSVVTANKHVVAHHGSELEAIARRTGASLRYEASVGGGIPVLAPLAADLAANRVLRVRGIVNGTTNYILSSMARDGRSYEAVLADAQAAGFAEADPRGDVEGDDAVNKLVIMARLAFGAWLVPSSIPRRPPLLDGPGRPGITGVTADEMTAAAALGLTIRLLASAGRVPESSGEDAADDIADGVGGEALDAEALAGEAGREAGEAGATGLALETVASVLPTAVPIEGPFGHTIGVLNRIEIEAEPLGRVSFGGPGAGGAATSSAVLGDLIALARGLGSTWAGLPAAPAGPLAEPIKRSPLRLQQGVGDRGWFAYLPGVRPHRVRAGEAGLYAVATASGIAIRSGPAPMAVVRASVAELLGGPATVTLYPIDE